MSAPAGPMDDVDQPFDVRSTGSWMIAGLSVGLFIIDIATPLGYADWILHLAPVAAATLLRRPQAPIVFALIGTVLAVAGYLLSPVPTSVTQFTDADNALLNRGFGVLAYWLIALTARAYMIQRDRMAATSWSRSVQADVAARVRGEAGLEVLCKRALDMVVTRLGAAVGVVYVVDDANVLVRVATVALPEDGPPARVPFGETVLGEVALRRETIELAETAPTHLEIRSATGKSTPGHVIVAPLLVDGDLHGVIELGFIGKIGASRRAAIDLLGEPLAAAIRTGSSRTRIERLLEQAQQLSNELHAQQEELRATNAQLESQTRAALDAHEQLELRQQRLRDINADLETEREAALQARELLRHRALELTASNRFKSEFLANVSHELRTPLNSALIMARLLIENRPGTLTAEQIKYAETIATAGNDLLALINDILDLSKVEAGKIELRIAPTAASDLVDAMKRLFAPVAMSRELTFTCELAPNVPPTIVTDIARASQVLKNLLSNAFKFTERGGVTLRVLPSSDGRGHPGVSFVVSDTGIGIPASEVENIFDQFRQADGSISRRFGGTGLGLAISRQLAVLLGGTLDVSSRETVGSAFTLWLPEHLSAPTSSEHARASVHVVDGPDATGIAAPDKRDRTDVPRRRSITIQQARHLLIVDDDAAFSGMLATLARERGFGVTVVGSAAAALQTVNDERVDGVILDLRLPDASGLSVLDELKQTPSLRHIPVHVVSGLDERERADRLGAAGFARKPMGPDQIAAVFEKLRGDTRGPVRRVLVVEDDTNERRSIVELLAASDVRIDEAPTLAAARKLLTAGSYDCWVLDLSLPDGAGTELLAEFRDPKRPPSVIIYTAQDLDPVQEQALLQFSSAIIIKGPESSAQLLDEVSVFLQRVETDIPLEQRRAVETMRRSDRIFEGRRILVVEDDVRNVFALASVLEPRGAELVIARNGREGVQMLARRHDIELVLMDVMMPEMDGLQATREIRRQPHLSTLPIIVLTAKSTPDDRDRCLDAGANDYLAKPIDIDRLVALIRVWLPK